MARKRKASGSSGSRGSKYARMLSSPMFASIADSISRSAVKALVNLGRNSTPSRKGGKRTPLKVSTKAKKRVQQNRGARTQQVKNMRGQSFGRSAWGNTNSKSKGFFRQSGRTKFTRLESIMKNGVALYVENGGIVGSSTAQAVSVGHACYTVDKLQYMLCYAVAKKISEILKLPFGNVDAKILGYGFNYLLRINYLTHIGASESLWQFTIQGATTKWSDVINSLKTIIGTSVLSGAGEQCILRTLWVHTGDLDPGAGVAYADFDTYSLYDAMVTFGVKSTLKLQNRTIQVAGGTADSVDNVPLYGKQYNVPGNYFYVRAGAASDYNFNQEVVSVNTGIYSTAALHTKQYNAAVAVEKPWIEPPSMAHTARVKSMNPAHLDPGEVKTSILEDYRRMNLNSLIRLITVYSSATSSRLCSLGSSRFFWFEKMIQSVANNESNFITLGYEVDEKYAMRVELKRFRSTAPHVIAAPL